MHQYNTAWCYLRYVNVTVPSGGTNSSCNFSITYQNNPENIMAELLGYDIWTYIAFIVLPLLYLTMHCYLRCKVMYKPGPCVLYTRYFLAIINLNSHTHAHMPTHPPTYTLVHTHILSHQVAKKRNGSHSLLSSVIRADLKLIFVPLIFLLLRIWSFIVDIPAFYLYEEAWLEFRRGWITAVLVLLSVSCTQLLMYCSARSLIGMVITGSI